MFFHALNLSPVIKKVFIWTKRYALDRSGWMILMRGINWNAVKNSHPHLEKTSFRTNTKMITYLSLSLDSFDVANMSDLMLKSFDSFKWILQILILVGENEMHVRICWIKDISPHGSAWIPQTGVQNVHLMT